MKTRLSVIAFSAIVFSSFSVYSQVASWNFNGVLTGAGSSNTVAGNASLGSRVPAGAFNGSTVYYGEGIWPGGGIDLNAYLEFSVTPTAGHSVTISSIVMQIRRSTTGSSGADPKNWSLRSSLDGYGADMASGVLSQSQQLSKGNQVLHIDQTFMHSGMYILIAESGSQKVSTKMIIP